MLLQISEAANFNLVQQLVQAHAYWRLKGLDVDLTPYDTDGERIEGGDNAGAIEAGHDKVASFDVAGDQADADVFGQFRDRFVGAGAGEIKGGTTIESGLHRGRDIDRDDDDDGGGGGACDGFVGEQRPQYRRRDRKDEQRAHEQQQQLTQTNTARRALLTAHQQGHRREAHTTGTTT